jgi:hypothetical protein
MPLTPYLQDIATSLRGFESALGQVLSEVKNIFMDLVDFGLYVYALYAVATSALKHLDKRRNVSPSARGRGAGSETEA